MQTPTPPVILVSCAVKQLLSAFLLMYKYGCDLVYLCYCKSIIKVNDLYRLYVEHTTPETSNLRENQIKHYFNIHTPFYLFYVLSVVATIQISISINRENISEWKMRILYCHLKPVDGALYKSTGATKDSTPPYMINSQKAYMQE